MKKVELTGVIIFLIGLSVLIGIGVYHFIPILLKLDTTEKLLCICFLFLFIGIAMIGGHRDNTFLDD